jgi:hypothetical protein
MDYTLCLMKVNGKEVYNDFIKGNYSEVKLSDLKGIKGKHMKVIKDKKTNTISIKNSEGISVNMVVTNCTDESRVCLWCIAPDPEIVLPEYTKIINGEITYYGSLKCCNFSCAVAYAIKEKDLQMEKFIHDIFDFTYAGKTLYTANDRLLLKIFGGPLSREEFEEYPSSYSVSKGHKLKEITEVHRLYMDLK